MIGKFLFFGNNSGKCRRNKKNFCHNFEINSFFSVGPGKTTYIVSASFRYGNGYIWQAILT